MTIEKKTEFRLLRKPRPPKLEKIDLKKLNGSFDVDDHDTSTDESKNNPDDSSSLSTLREFSSSSSIRLNKPKPHDEHRLVLPCLNPDFHPENSINSHKTSLKSASTSSLPDAFSFDDANNNNNFTINHKQALNAEVNYYMKTFEKNVFRGKKLSTIRSATLNEPTENKPSSVIEQAVNKTLVKSVKSLGPDPLPKRRLKFHLDNSETRKAYFDNLTYDDYCYFDNAYDFNLNDFLLNETRAHFFLPNDLNKSFISNRNYRQICKMLADKIDQIRSIDSKQMHVQTLAPNIEPFEKRKPLRQSMIEMASFLKNELSNKTGTSLKTKFKPMSKWDRLNGAHAELIIYEDKNAKKEKNISDEDSQISPAQLAIVDSLLRNGLTLSLKAHFIDTLPDLSPLRSTLIYINLSFNNFKEVPAELLTFYQLEGIKMRSNPIKHLPDALNNLHNLKILVFSYCQLTEISPSVFELENLAHLDVSYNRLKTINEQIINLRNLKTLNYEGNELEYLPCCMLAMGDLEQINVKNNYLHPLIWRRFLIKKIPSLFEIAANCFVNNYSKNSIQFSCLSGEVRLKLKQAAENFCDNCRDKVCGDGLQLIRPCDKIFGVKFLPFLFTACSFKCLNSLKKRPT